MKWKKIRKRMIIIILLITIFIYLNNSSDLTKARHSEPLLLAHRGMAQSFSMVGIEGDTCTAEHIDEPVHPYLENTIPSMKAAFTAGANVVELDVRPTKDGQLAVFHDWTLDCRTDATGEPKLYTMAELKQVDIGYGYTADGGKTYPFRGKGVGLMPSLTEVLTHFPEGQFLIHIKSNEAEEGVQLAELIAHLPVQQQRQLTVYGGDAPIQAFKTVLPKIPVMSKATLKSCLLPYIGLGWTGYVPKACHHTQIHVPENIAPWLWGWPNKFLNRMDGADTRVILVAGNGKWSEGFDSLQDLERLPTSYTGGIWTNRIDLIAPIVKESRTNE
ncbi:glycerophosphodiester phosphodiesterase family protein [Lysinibacillus piscis]|uniref:Glycerophosphoryl diester phosphodiesterase n=1 Tax=Lysinibacillus piscis TaxID=2518931 RepID=A0ABQ5NKV7_9BACI|nr:glycerophosphodiester phosphodiesterase family protein [Lysinibacillus sp. KH24]GLC88993.1 glycerophosphoryl diester phosphodiesterase [Lysinibacillus sp. KH24]